MRYMGHDQYGAHYALGEHPRKELLAQLGSRRAAKMYIDRADGTYHVGYIISDHWITVYGLEGVVFAKREGQATSAATAITRKQEE